MPNKRERILTATQDLLSKHGFHGFSMKQLADSAGVAAGSIYNHFENKEDLILQLHLQILTDIAAYAFETHDDKATLFDQYQNFWMQFWNYCLDHPEAVLCKDQFDHLPPKQKAVQSEKIIQLFEPMTQFFENGKAKKVFKDLDNEVLSALSLETSTVLARLQLMQQINLSEDNIKEVIKASWHSISK